MLRKIIPGLLFGLLLSGCGGGGEDSSAGATHITDPALTNSPSMAVANLPYQYHPALSGDIEVEKYHADNLPEWATLDETTGAISGTPDSEDVTAYHPFRLSVAVGGNTFRFDQALSVRHTESYLPNQAVDFQATDYDGKNRPIRNDLDGGSLAGEVMFAQSHTVLPDGNHQVDAGDETNSVYRPRLVALREALLLFTPDTSDMPTTVDVQLAINGEPVGTYPMAHSNALPASDHEGRHRIEYSTRAWSLRLPWEHIRNGLSLTFTTNKSAPDAENGTLPAAGIEIGDASQIVFQSIRLGLLTHFEDNADHFTLRDPVLAATDYFQTLPVSRMVMASYADMQLDEVIIGSGKIYTEVSDTDGGVYSGDMRGDVAKSQVSVGINQANYGLTSSNMRQWYTHVFKQITNHHAWGNYQNGRIRHGLSGGNGIGTLVKSRGNEASHEWGHAYGLGHYPGKELTEDGRWQRHHADSGWGFIAHRNRMRDNLSHNSWSDTPKPHGSHFMEHIPYRYDSMSGGGGGNRFSQYTHYTGYSARIIQNDLARYPIPDVSYPTGYKKWNTATGQYESHVFPGDMQVSAPTKVGVPVATLLGGYDPDGTAAVIYPVFHGNYGNVFDLPEPAATGDACWVSVSNAKGEQKQISVGASRHYTGTINQLHINLAAEFRPTLAILKCRRGGDEIELTRTEFDGQIPELPTVAIVGQKRGFDQLKVRELATLNDALGALVNESFPVPDSSIRVLLDSYTQQHLADGLDENARTVLSKLDQIQASVNQARALLNKLQNEDVSPSEIQSRLTDLLFDSGMINTASDIELVGTIIETSQGHQLSTATDSTGYITVVTGAEGQAEPARWLLSARGSLHPVDQPWRCLVPSNGKLALANCSPNQPTQKWQQEDNLRLQNADTEQCIDFAYTNGEAVMYNCHDNWNQKWEGVTESDSPILAALPGKVIQALYQ
ncbi:MAG: M66 family metalloprotease [Marinobacter sp.]